MSCVIYEFSAGKIVPASSMTNLVTKDIKIEILCHVKPKEQSFTTCDLFWTNIQTGIKEKSNLETLEGEVMILLNVDEGDHHHLRAWSYFTIQDCLIVSSLKFNGDKHKHTIGLLKINKNSEIRIRSIWSSHERHGNYTQKDYTITFDGENFAVDLKTEELPPEYFGQR